MGTDHGKNRTRGKHCMATCVNETLTPKPLTDNSHINNNKNVQQKREYTVAKTSTQTNTHTVVEQKKFLDDQLTCRKKHAVSVQLAT